MADITKEIIVEVNVEGNADKELAKVTKEVKKLEDAQEDLEKQTKETTDGSSAFNAELTGMLDSLGIAPAAFGAASKGANIFTTAMKLMRSAVIATGIGALLIALTSLIAFFTKSQKGADLLSKGLAILGGIVDVITTSAIKLGEGIVAAFTDPVKAIKDFKTTIDNFLTPKIEALVSIFSGLGDVIAGAFTLDPDQISRGLDATEIGFKKLVFEIKSDILDIVETISDVVAKVVDDVTENVNRAIDIQDRIIANRERELKFITRSAELEARISEARLITDDTTKSIAERTEALAKAEEANNEIFFSRNKILAEEIKILELQQAQGENLHEDNVLLAELKAQQILLRKEETDRARELLGVEKAIADQNLANIAATEAARDKAVEDEIAREDALAKSREETAASELRILEANTKAKEDALQSIIDKEEELAGIKRDNTKEDLEAALDALSIIFGDSKALAVAQAIMNTYVQIAAFAGRPIRQIIAAVTGAAQVAKILRTTEDSTTVEAAEGGMLPKGGGMMRGRRHAQGGIRFMAGGRSIEAEGGEFIVNRKATSNFLPMLKAINDTGRRMEHGGLLHASRLRYQVGGGIPNAGDFVQNGFNDLSRELSSTLGTVNTTQTVLVTEDLDVVQDRVSITEDRATL